MYHLSFYDKRRKKEMQVSYPTYEQVLSYERGMDFECFSHDGEIIGTDMHEDWYALKTNGAWQLFNREWDK